jgi:hypothetical protein
MWVVKLGGSLAASEALTGWLAVVARSGAGKVVIVPGGGPFADTVRSAQAQWRFDNLTAHRMALKAMDQFGLMLCGLSSTCKPATGLTAIDDFLAKRCVPVWLPSAIASREPEIPATWDMTSDSLAAWLARELCADRLVLVKSCALPSAETAELARRGVVDAAFPSFAAGLEVGLFNRDDPGIFSRQLERYRPSSGIARQKKQSCTAG